MQLETPLVVHTRPASSNHLNRSTGVHLGAGYVLGRLAAP